MNEENGHIAATAPIVPNVPIDGIQVGELDGRAGEALHAVSPADVNHTAVCGG